MVTGEREKRDGVAAPRVSVVVPCYNGARYLPESLDSILAQTYRDLEVVVVDDGSSDGSREYVRSVCDDRVRLFEHGRNLGIAAARNTGVRNARGEFVAFLDQDDLWHPHKLAKQVDVLDRPEMRDVGLVFTRREILQDGRRFRKPDDGKFPRPIHEASRQEILKAFLGRNFVPMISVLVRRRCFDEVGLFDEDIRSGVDDFDWCARFAMHGRFACVDEVLVTRREHVGNYTDSTRFFDDDLRVLDHIVREDPTLERWRRRRHAQLLFECGRWWHVKGDRRRAHRAYWQSLAVSPFKCNSLAALAILYTGPVGAAAFSLYRLIRYGKN